MNLLKKNIEAAKQRDYYSFPKKNPVLLILSILGILAIWYLCQGVFSLVYGFITRELQVGNMQMIMLGLGNILATVIFLFTVMRKDKKYLPKATSKMSKLEIASGMFFVLMLSGLGSVIVDSVRYLTGSLQVDGAVESMYNANIFVQIFVSVISAGVGEEVVFRGCIQNKLMGRINGIWAFIITGMIFGLAHGNVPQFITATVSGAAMCFVYAKTRSLGASIAAHMFNNAIAFVQADFVTQDAGEPMYWIFSILLIVVSGVLAIPFIKADAVVIEKQSEEEKDAQNQRS